MSVEDSETRRFELNISLSVSEADLGPTSCQELFCVFFSKVRLLKIMIRAHSARYRSVMAVVFEMRFFFLTSRFY